jgi:hypothetical protein
MTLVNIAKDDFKPLFIDVSDITAMQVISSGAEIIIYNSQGPVLSGKSQDWNLDVATVVQKLENSGAHFVPLTLRRSGVDFLHYIAADAVTFAQISAPVNSGMVGAIIGVRGAGWLEGGAMPDDIDAFLNAVRQTRTLFEYKPEEAYSRYHDGALYIAPDSVVRMQGSLDHNQIDVFFDNCGRLDAQVAYHNQFDPVNSFEQKAIDIFNSKKYTGPHQDIAAIKDIIGQLKQKASQDRVDFVNKIAAANGNLVNISTATCAAFLRKEDIGMVSFYEDTNSGAPGLTVRSKEKQGGFGVALSLDFNTVAERNATLAVLLQRGAVPNKPKSNPGLKP